MARADAADVLTVFSRAGVPGIVDVRGRGGHNTRGVRCERIGMDTTTATRDTVDPALEPLLRPSDVAERLGVSRTWLYDAAKDGRIPSVRLRGTDGPLRVVPEDLRAWIEASRAAWRPGKRAVSPRG